MITTTTTISMTTHTASTNNHTQNVCDWRQIDRHLASLSALLAGGTTTQGNRSEDATPIVSPYQAVTFPFSPEQVGCVGLVCGLPC
jgi:hypothetical protein